MDILWKEAIPVLSFLVRMLIHALAIGCLASHALRYGLANCAFSDSRVSVVRRVALWQVYPARRCRRLHERGRFLGALASIGFLYARSGEHSVPVTSVIVALTCSAMAGALGYCSKRLAIRLRSITTRAWDALILIAL